MRTKEFYLKEFKKYGIIPGNHKIENLERLYRENVLPKKKYRKDRKNNKIK